MILCTANINYVLPGIRQDADLRGDRESRDHHPRGRELRHHRQRQGQDPGQGHPYRPEAPHLRREGARGRSHPFRLLYPEGFYPAPRSLPRRRVLKNRRECSLFYAVGEFSCDFMLVSWSSKVSIFFHVNDERANL